MAKKLIATAKSAGYFCIVEIRTPVQYSFPTKTNVSWVICRYAHA